MIYLDTAGVGIIQPPVIEKITDYNKTHQLRGKLGVKEIVSEALPSLKKNISKLINCAPENIAYTSNTTEGINIVTNGYPWKKGDRILIPDNEYPANVYPWINLKRIGVEIDFIPTNKGHIDLDRLSAMITDKTKMLSISHVSYISGYKSPLEKLGLLCKELGVIFFVDAAQSIGLNEIDVQKTNISALVTCGWKWLMGPIGSGFIYCSKEFLKKIRPTYIGMDSMKENHFPPYEIPMDYYSDARKFEYSSLNIASIVGLNEAIRIINSVTDREERTRRNIYDLKSILDEMGFKYYLNDTLQNTNTSGILSVKHPNIDSKIIYDYLLNNNVHTALWHGYVRFSPSYLTTVKDLKAFKTIINHKIKNL